MTINSNNIICLIWPIRVMSFIKLVFVIIIITIWPSLVSVHCLFIVALFHKCHETNQLFSGLTASTGLISIVECTVLLCFLIMLSICFIHSLLFDLNHLNKDIIHLNMCFFCSRKSFNSMCMCWCLKSCTIALIHKSKNVLWS